MDHKNCEIKCMNFSKQQVVGACLAVNGAHLALIQENRTVIGILVDILLYTATQNLSRRGHDEWTVVHTDQGNFFELFKLFGRYNDVKKKIGFEFSALLKNAQYTSPKIQNEILFIF